MWCCEGGGTAGWKWDGGWEEGRKEETYMMNTVHSSIIIIVMVFTMKKIRHFIGILSG